MSRKSRLAAWCMASLAAGAVVARLIRTQGSDSGRLAKLRGRAVLITGGSRGLGFALAQEFAVLGCRLVLVSRNMDELARAKSRLVMTQHVPATDVFLCAADVGSQDAIRTAVEEATARFGQIDIVINNAGIIFVGPVENQQVDSFQQAMESNFFGALHTTCSVLPQMLRKGEGAIVNIASIGGKLAFPHLLPYVASKFALTGWSQGLRAELASRGIRVTTVVPGIMRTGSHVQARYTGNAAKEYRWFASAASFPATATSAKAAARKIVKALVSNKAEVSIGWEAIVASRVSNLFPNQTAAALELVNQLLPEPARDLDTDFWGKDRSQAGHLFRGSLPAPLEKLGASAMEQYNQQAAPSSEG